MKNLYLIGGGGHCKSCIDVIEVTNQFVIKGIFDQKCNISKQVFSYDIIGSDDDIAQYVSEENYFLITIGQIKSADLRINLYNKLRSLNANFATIISPRSHVSKHAKIGNGTIIMHDALVNAGAEIGENCIINTKSLIEHETKIKSHCHISTAAIVNGNCTIETECFIGSNAVLKEGIEVSKKTIISAGSFYRG